MFDIGTFISIFLNFTSGQFLPLFSNLSKFIPAILNILSMVLSGSTGRILCDGILDIAIATVDELAKDGTLDNTAKRGLAFDRIKTKAISEGKEVRDHVIDLAIDFAISRLKS